MVPTGLIRRTPFEWLNGRGLAGQLNNERSEGLAEGLGVEWVRWTFRSRTSGRLIERSDCIALAVNAECNEADEDGAIRQRGGGANLVLLLHNPLAISPGEGSPNPSGDLSVWWQIPRLTRIYLQPAKPLFEASGNCWPVPLSSIRYNHTC
jgi:hypothetical protein